MFCVLFLSVIRPYARHDREFGHECQRIRRRMVVLQLFAPQTPVGFMRILLLLLSLGLPGTALADVDFQTDKDARADVAVMAGCFDAAMTWEDAQACVNITYQPCIARLGRKASHADESACNYREVGLWEHLLQIETRKLEAWTVLKDNQIVAESSLRPNAHEIFLRGEQSWAAYLRAQCDFQVQEVAGGTAGMTVGPHCAMDRTVERLFTLRPFLKKIMDEGQP